MFLFIGGVGPNEAPPIDQPDQPCPACGAYSLKERRVDQVMSLFFMPLVTVHKGRPFRVCSACGWDSRLESGTTSDDRTRVPTAVSSHVTHPAATTRLACPQCGHAVQDSYLFCPFCGTHLD